MCTSLAGYVSSVCNVGGHCVWRYKTEVRADEKI